MNEQVEILAVAPYEGLATILERESLNYPDISMTVITGNLEEGVAAAIDRLVEPFDLILSRGGTADLLRQSLDIPVVDIKTSALDVLQALQFSEDINGKRAVVGFRGITDAAHLTSDVLHLDLDIFTLVDEKDVHNVTGILAEQGYDTVLCDVISSTVFREAGFNTVLITSGTNSVRESIDEAVRVAHHMRSVHNENVFFREVISNSGTDTVIFQEDDSLSFTTVDRGGGKALI
ncbi:MAG: PrpR N-terminal domain-containing protein, partial [Atopobiaceae bacterium]|nr:PrpR N-terminal domain-containing protein [Atopobiaceae bacterium]